MSSPGFKRWGATTGSNSASGAGSRSDGTSYQSPTQKTDKVKAKPSNSSYSSSTPSHHSSDSSVSLHKDTKGHVILEIKNPFKKDKKEKKDKPPASASPPSHSSPASVSPKPPPKPVTSSAPSYSSSGAVQCGLNSTTYEKQPSWATAEQHKNRAGQYQDGMFRSTQNDHPAVVHSSSGGPKPSTVQSHPTSYSSTQSTAPYKTTSSSPSSSGSTVQCGLNSTTYEKQPSWATAEQHKNNSGQYHDGMFRGTQNDHPGHTGASGGPKPSNVAGAKVGGSPKCPYCGKAVFHAERQLKDGQDWHASCVSQEYKARNHTQSSFSSYPK